MRTITIHNVSGIAKMYVGQSIAVGETYTLNATDVDEFAQSTSLFNDVAAGAMLVGNTDGDITNVIAGWAWMLGDEITIKDLPLSDIEGMKLAVHPSYKPIVADTTTYAVWTGSGDDIISNPSLLGEGDLMHFDMSPGNAVVSKDIKFDHVLFGRVWIHEAYLQFTGGGEGDYVSSDVMAEPAALQTSVNLDLELNGNFVKLAAGGPGTGTHGFAATPSLIPRTYSKDGDWNYDGINLTPNMDGTGEYKISTVETAIHKYVNKIPTYGSSPYFSMSSDETAELLPGYFLRIDCHNISDTTWHLSVIMELYRQQTV